jgi:hypothetical protein
MTRDEAFHEYADLVCTAYDAAYSKYQNRCGEAIARHNALEDISRLIGNENKVLIWIAAGRKDKIDAELFPKSNGIREL